MFRLPAAAAATATATIAAVVLAAACSPTRPVDATLDSPALLSEQQRAHPESHAAWREIYAARDIDGEPLAPIIEEHGLTMVVVFATWCAHCKRELGILEQLGEEEPRVGIIGVNYYEDFDKKSDEAKMRAYVKEKAPWLRVMQGDAVLLRLLGGVPKIPSIFLFDADGKLLATFKRSAEVAPPDLPALVDAVQAGLAAEQ